jgi:hypothetical protein
MRWLGQAQRAQDIAIAYAKKREAFGKVLGEQRRVYMGLGEAVLRLIHVELLYATNSGVEAELVTERNLIVQALNQQYQLDLGFDCNADAVPDTVEIFQQSAKTSCCRILPMDGEDSDSGRKEKFGSGRRVENLPDIEKVKENLADFMAKAPLTKPSESPLASKPKPAPKPTPKPDNTIYPDSTPVDEPVKRMAKGGSASARADGIAQRGKTRGTIVMCGGGMYKK